jgi:membrane fusion protein, copper/silver efflux system
MKRFDIKGILQKRGVGVTLLVVTGFILGLFVSMMFSEGGKTSHGVEAQEHADHEEDSTTWTCSMHPQVKRPEPGPCPYCGMKLIPLKNEGDEPGPSTVVLSERAKILARIGTSPVARLKTSGTDLRLLGRIETSETSMKNITAWTGGRIDRLHVKVTGQSVRKGQVIATLYSPEVFGAHQDLIVAKRQVARMADSSETARLATDRALEASKNRLRLLGVPDDEIAGMAAADKPTRQIAIRTPFAGTVIKRVATEGAYVQTGALLYMVADLSRLWVQLDAYESDLPGIVVGQEVGLHVEGIADDAFTGKVDFIDPIIDPTRRTARVRVAVTNKERRLRPGMFVQADLKAANSDGRQPPLIIPSSAPLFTGRRAIVFVEDPSADRPTYTARTVRLGPRTGEVYPVVAGLNEGERVVTKGAFTLDADLQIRGGNSMMAAPDDSAMTGEDLVIRVAARDRKKLVPVLDAYLEVQKTLAADDFEKGKAAAKKLAKQSGKVTISGPSNATKFWKKHGAAIREHAVHLSKSGSMEEARGIFEPLSRSIIALLERLGNPLNSPVRLAFCPMAMGSKGARWVQRGEVVDNSYFGDLMRTCGEIQSTIEAGQYLMIEKPAAKTASSAPARGHQH